MRPGRKCLECTPYVDPDGVHRDIWIRCSYFYEGNFMRACRASRISLEFTEMEDGRIKPSSCPLDYRRY